MTDRHYSSPSRNPRGKSVPVRKDRRSTPPPTAPAVVRGASPPSATESTIPKPQGNKTTSTFGSATASAISKTPSSKIPHKQSVIAGVTSIALDKGRIDINVKDQNDTEAMKVHPSKEKTEIETCAICLDDCTEPKQLDKCGHTFCKDCIDYYFHSIKPQCPCCFTIYGEIRGNQPENGKMRITRTKHRLPGFQHNSYGTFQISYYFPNGVQDERHPNPGTPYSGTTREAYLPDNEEGQHVLKLLQKAFEVRQIFTVGESRTTGSKNVVTWNDIHHKTNVHGGMENFGYPDPTYLNRVQQELAAKGIQ